MECLVPVTFLQIVTGPRQGTNVNLFPDKPTVIGRKRGDFLLDDPLVSSIHCQLVPREGGYALQDMNSTNGTMVDGKLVKDLMLRTGAEIVIGGHRMILCVGEDQEQEEQRRKGNHLDVAWVLDEELVELRGSGERTRPRADVIGQDLRLPPSLTAEVEVMAGQDAGKVFRFSKGNVSVGRRQGDVPLSDVEVSRNHAVIEVFGREMVFLRDLGSTNGTYHNGQRVAVGRLQTGDTIGCGKTVMKLRLGR